MRKIGSSAVGMRSGEDASALANAPPSRLVDACFAKLPPRELKTLKWLNRGLPTKSIATKMGLQEITVRKYVSHLLEHFQVRRRTELIVIPA